MYWAKWTVVFWVAIIVSTPGSLMAKTVFVDANAVGRNDGSSWANAYRCLQDALADANTAEKPVEIRVARGVYRPDEGRGFAPGDREATFRLINGITLKGGYAGIGAANPEVCDLAKYPSVLSGDLNGNDAPAQSEDQLIGQPMRSDNSRHVVTVAVEDSCGRESDPLETGAVIDGFTITAGQDDVKAFDLASMGGAGILLVSGALSVVDCTIQGNGTCNVGGGMYTTAGCRPTLGNCTFKHNYAQYGGGIGSGQLYAVSEGCRLAMTGCTFSENHAFQGAGLFSYGGRTEATACVFQDNAAKDGDSVAFGGGMYLLGTDVVLTGCSFSANTADRSGGAISQATGHAKMISCTFSRNAAGAGGAIDTSNCDSVLDGCTFTGNVAPSGGGLYSTMSPLTVTHCLFVGNGADAGPKRSFGTHREGGAIYLFGTATLANCTFHGNRAQKGQSLWMSQADVTITSCILWDEASQIYADDGVQPTVTYSDVATGHRGDGNICADPDFARPGYWDPNGTPDSTRDDSWVDGDYHLKSQAGRWDPNSQSWVTDAVSSPCIDAGDPNAPICDEPQPNGGWIDMGAYGGTAEASKSCLRTISSFVWSPYWQRDHIAAILD